MEQVFAEETAKAGAGFTLRKDVCINAYHIPEDARVCRRFAKAAAMIGLTEQDITSKEDPPKEMFVSTFGGSDNNYLTKQGIMGIVPSSGMYNPHSTEEYSYIKDLEQGAELVAALCMISD